jgi:hypothetical protein
MSFEEMDKGTIDLFHQVTRDFDGMFAGHIAHLGLGTDGEMVRWLNKVITTELTIEKLKKSQWGRVAKASPVYEYDNNKKYVVVIIPEVFASMTTEERKAYVFYLLSQISVSFSKKGDVRFGTNNSYTAERLTEQVLGKALPKPEELGARMGLAIE